MARTQRRPWLAALLGAFLPALGHVYLRRWLRGAGWIGVTLLSTVFVPDATLDALVSGESFAWLDAAPLLVVSALSVVDAYRIAVVQNYLRQLQATGGTIGDVATGDSPAGAVAVCPECGKQVDHDLAFCQWCAEPLAGTDPADTESARPGAQ